MGSYQDSVVKLVSTIIEEEIVLDCEDSDDFDPGRIITVPLFSLLVCTHGTLDDDSDPISEGEVLLKSKREIDASDVCGLNPSDLLSNYNNHYYVSHDGESRYLIESVYENEFRFATETEIEKFVKKLPKAAIKFWFEEIVTLFDLILRESDK